jgi:hypothetical protein
MIIFDSMAAITQGQRNLFVVPSNPNEFEQKHQEIERKLEYRGILPGMEIALGLMEEMFRRICQIGGVPGVDNLELLNAIKFNANHEAILRLNAEFRWMAEWEIDLYITGSSYTNLVSLDIYDSAWGEIVPTYVMEYICTALLAYKRGLHSTSIALLSIALEATLRDVLSTRGYSFIRGASPVDLFPYSSAEVGVDGNHYTLTFLNNMPKMPGDFLVSTGGQPIIHIYIGRKINDRKNRVDMVILTPPALLDHWSDNQPNRLAQSCVNGLGEAIRICKNIELVLTSDDLPVGVDEVIIAVRNNLIHLSEGALANPLLMIDPQGNLTVGKFLQNPAMVYDLVLQLPRVINQQYLNLRRAGFYI